MMTWTKQEPASLTFTATDADGSPWTLTITTSVNGKNVTLQHGGTSLGTLSNAPSIAFLKDLFGQVAAQL
jgi:hypothetical protein